MATRYNASISTPVASSKIPASSTTRTATPAPVAPKPAAAPLPYQPAGPNVRAFTPEEQKYVSTQPAPVPAGPNIMDIDNQVANARNFGASAAAHGQSIFNTQQTAANKFGQTGQNYAATGQSITAPGGMAGPAPTGSPQFMGQLVQGGKIGGAPAAAPAGPPAFATGKQVQGGNMGGVSNVDPSQLGGYGSVAGGLGGGYQVGGVANVAGRLGGAPQVGNVGNVQMGSAPGSVQGTFGNMGAQSADQAGMMARLNGFLDGPEGPSVAEAQLREAQATNMGQMIGMARSGRGGAGAQAQALEGAMSEGGAISSQTAGQMATLRAQEADMLKNRQLSAIGLGGEMSTAARGQDLSFRGQNLQAAQGDQSTQLGARGQDLTGAMANQSTQTQLEQLRAQTGIAARGQDLSALQGDQSTGLGLEGLRANTSVATRGQDLSALQGDQGAAIAARGQNLSALQGNQSTQLGARGQNVQQEANVLGANTALRGQDLSALTSDADRNLAAQQLQANTQLGYGALQNQAQGMGLNFLQATNQQAMLGEGMAQDAINNNANNLTSINNANTMADAGIQQQIIQNQGQPSFGQRAALAGIGAVGSAAGGAMSVMLSDERAKTDISPLDAIGDHLRGAPGYRYRYKEGVGEDTSVEHAGPMAQDLERGPFGKALVRKGPDGLRRVDTGRLTLVNHAALASMRGELDRIRSMLDERAA